MFRPVYVGHLQFEIQLKDELYKMCGRLSGDWVWGERHPVVSIVGTMTQGFHKCMCNTQNSLLLNQHNGDDTTQEYTKIIGHILY